MRRQTLGGAVISALFLTVAVQACSDRESVAPNRDLTPSTATAGKFAEDLMAERARRSGQLPDSLFVEAEVAAPGFAGMFYDLESHQLTIGLVPGASADAAKSVIRELFSKARGVNGEIAVKSANYGFRQLSRWRDLVEGTSGIPYISSDVDEINNVVSFGVTDLPTSVRMVNYARQVGVPDDAIRVRIVSRPEVVSGPTLDSIFRTLRSGTLISFDLPPVGGSNCSLGPLVTIAQVPYAVTASHCTRPDAVMGGVDGAAYYQPLNFSSDYIGYETTDPGFSTSVTGCYPAYGEICRWSDAALVRLVNADGSTPTVYRGVLAKTSWYATGNNPPAYPGGPLPDTGSKAVVGILQITEEDSTPYLAGAAIHKIGRTTGWTWGSTTASCSKTIAPSQPVDYSTGVARTRFLLCQFGVATTVEGGDSGSPAFIYWVYGDGSLRGFGLAGVVSAKVVDTQTGKITMMYSPMYAIRRELGSSMVTF